MLELSSIGVGYHATQVVFDLSLVVGNGQIVALLGANGAGKTTVLRAISGLLRPRQGSIIFDGRDLKDFPAHRRVALGIGHVPEGRRIFPELSVFENLMVGAHCRRSARNETIEEVLALFPRLGERLRQQGGTLSGGEQQMLAIGRALMSRPTLLMLDEPSLGLAPAIVDRLYEQVAALRGRLSILLVEQNMALALSFSDYAYVLRQGRVVDQGPAQELAKSQRVESAYFAF